MNNVGESQIGPQVQQQITPDIVNSPQGLQQLHSKMSQAIMQKKTLDRQLELVAKVTGTDFQSRIKNATTVVQKIAQKRLQGRDYGLEDLNDAYGGRFIIDKKGSFGKVLDLVRKLADQDSFKILKDENVKTGTYTAHHVDFQTPEGLKGEIQLMTPQGALESVANHGLRAVAGEKPEEPVKTLRDKQAQMASRIGDNEAKKKVETIQSLMKAGKDSPLDPRIVANVMQSPI